MSAGSTADRDGAGSAGLWRAVRDALWPPHCIACGTLVDGQPGLCPDCWKDVTFLGAPQCARCGIPFPVPVADGAVCGVCAQRAPAYERARAALLYDDSCRPLVLGFKHGDRLDATALFAGWMTRAGHELLATAEVVVPVPLHWSRLVRRRYNQAAVLASRLSANAGIAYAPGSLVRRRRTPSLGHMGAAARRSAVRGAFAVPRRAVQRVSGKRCLLVDDVLTSGATAEECARVLVRAGARAVDVLALARTPLHPI